MKTFIVSYSFDERKTMLELKAKSRSEAEARIIAMLKGLRLEGELISKSSPLGPKSTQHAYRALGLL